LLAGERGCEWSAGNQKLAFAFDRAIPGVRFEGGRKNKIRLYLVDGELRPGKLSRTLTVRLPPGGAVRPSLTSRYGATPGPDWAANLLPWDIAPVDVSFLNDGDRPAASTAASGPRAMLWSSPTDRRRVSGAPT